MYAAVPPNDATPHMVLAAEPPDISIGATIAAWSESARSASMRVIEPFDEGVLRSMNSVVVVGDDVDQCVADADHVVAGRGRRPPLRAPIRSRIVRWGWHDAGG